MVTRRPPRRPQAATAPPVPHRSSCPHEERKMPGPAPLPGTRHDPILRWRSRCGPSRARGSGVLINRRGKLTMNMMDRLTQANGQPVEVDGVLVNAIYRRRITSSHVMRVHRSRAKPFPVQGLRVRVDGGIVTVRGRVLNEVVLWADTAPEDVEVVCEIDRGRAAGEVRVWNCWREADGTMQAWLGDAGMIVEESNMEVRLRCSDGTSPFSPADLDVTLSFESI
jgi:hypothetical protein